LTDASQSRSKFMNGNRKGRQLLSAGEAVCSYTIVKLIGQGGFSDVYLVKDRNSGEDLAMKMESRGSPRRSLEHERLIVQHLRWSPFFPMLMGAGSTLSHDFIVFELLGPSLSTIRKRMPDSRCTISTTLRLAAFMLQAIRELHHAGFVHQDIKPSNFLLKPGEFSPLVLIDFGISRRFLDAQTRRPYPARTHCGFQGTARYISVKVHEGCDHSPRDDLMSWLYSVVELVDGKLPWAADTDMVKIEDKKRAIPDQQLLRSLPIEFCRIARYIRGLKYGSVVDYDRLMYYVVAAVWKVDQCVAEPFDWERWDGECLRQISDQELPCALNYAGRFPQVKPSAPMREIVREEPEKYGACPVA